ncbi:MAG TPA: hypothetical protein VFP39_05975 [Gemmatimonadales bacterium]|nr:hypothetical protein [Gemmatimonadales bacterium]
MKTLDREDGIAVLEAGGKDASGAPQDLFSSRPAPAVKPRKMRAAPELTAARVLCRQLSRKRVSADKKRIIHLICLNLVTVLKRRSPQA